MALPLIVTTPGTATSAPNAAINSLNPLINIANSQGYLLPSGDTSGATDYANITAAFAAMAGYSTNLLTFAPGQYYVNAKLVFNWQNSGQSNVAFVCMGTAIITQVTANTGVWEFQVPSGYTPNIVTLEGISLTYSSQQSSSNTSAVCLGVRGVNGTTPNATTFEWRIHRCQFYYGYRGIANTQPAGQFPWWGIKIHECNFGNLSGASIRIVSPSSVGQPNIEVTNCLDGGPYSGGSEASIQIDACDSLTLKNLEWLGVISQTVYYLSASIFQMMGCKAESYTPSTSGAINTVNSVGTITNFSMNGAFLGTGASNCILNQSQTAQGVVVDNLYVSASTGTGTCRIFACSGGALYVTSPPTIAALGSGPGVFSLQDSGGSSSANVLNVLGYQGGEMSDDIGDASLTWTGYSPAVNGTASAHYSVWNTALTANRTITLNGTNGTAAADNLWDGAEAVFVRTANATGASTLTVNGTIPSSKTIAIGAYSKWKWRRSLGWVEAESGSL
jgi:hypothetical protein